MSSRILVDRPASEPALGFQEYARALTGVIAESDPQFAVGIFGPWGSGKTTLMQTIRAGLNPSDAIAIDFSAWRYEREEHLIVPLLDTLREGLLAWTQLQPDPGNTVRDAAATVGKVMRSIIAGLSLKMGVPGGIELSFEANKALEEARNPSRGMDGEDARVPQSFYHAAFRGLRSSFEAVVGDSGRRIVVFVDDLDRCLPQSALEVIESMKLFFDLPGFVFVVGLDRAVVQAMVDERYRTRVDSANNGESRPPITGDEYIQKIFQVPFSLPPVRVGHLDEFLRAVYRQARLGREEVELLRPVRRHLDYLVEGGSVNPREVKRYINAYLLQMDINPALNPDVVLALQTLVFRRDWERANQALLTWRQFLVDALNRRLTENDPSALEGLDPGLGAVPDSFLDYLGSGAPGHALLSERAIERYISSSEAASHRESYGLIEAMAILGRLQKSLREKAERAEVEPGPIDLGDVNVNEVASLSSMLARGSDASGGAMEEDLRQLTGSLVGPVRADDPAAWYEDIAANIIRIRRRVMDRYQR